MATFSMRHEVACDADRFFRIFFDRDFTTKMYTALEFPSFTIVEQHEDDKEIRRVVRATPKLDLPGPVAKVMGAGFSYTEEGRFDRATKRFAWTLVPGSMADKVKNTGVVYCVPGSNEGSCVRVCDVDLTVKVFGLGGVIESALEKNLRAGWQRGADYFNDAVKKGEAPK
jgi:hypothetical protein